MKTLSLSGKQYTFPLSDRYRRHSADERERMDLSGDIEYPILLYKDTTLGLDDCVLDGEGRIETAIRAGSLVEFKHVGSMTTEEAYERSKALNDARRHDDHEAIQRRRERIAQARAGGDSIRTIAEKEKVDPKTVRNHLAKSGGEGSPPEQIIGKDGKKQRSRKRKGKARKVSVTCDVCKFEKYEGEDCPSCKKREAAGKTPADEVVDKATEFPFGANAPETNEGGSKTVKPPKNGRVKFDWRKLEEDFGRLVRNIDEVATAHNDKRADEYAHARELLGDLLKTWKAWRDRLSHGEAS